MAIVYDGTGGLFTRLGKLFQLKKVTNTFRTTLRTEIDDVIAVYADADKDMISELIASREQLDTRLAGIDSMIDNACLATLHEQVKSGLSLEPRGLQDALRLLIDDMTTTSTKTVGGSSVTQTVHVDASSVGTTVAAVDVTANAGTMLVSTKMPMSQLGSSVQKEKQNLRAETLRADCVQDESSGVAAGSEVFLVTGKEARDAIHYEWPLGSGTKTSVRVTSASGNTERRSGPGGNVLSNSGFDNWSTATSCQLWTADSTRASGSFSSGGDPSSSNPIERQATNFSPDGVYAIEFNGDGNEKHRVYQKLGSQSGTPGRVYPLKTYIVSFRIRAQAGTITSGVLKASLTDGSYTDISTATVSHDCSSSNLTTTWVHKTAVWQTDSDSIAKDSRFVIQFTTALQNAKSLLVDELVLFEPVSLYAGGPEIGFVRGSADFRNNDRFTLAVTNDNAGEFQTFFDQVFGTCQRNLNLPIAGTNRMNDTLIG
mgnify:CR=1 FL=1